MENNALSRTTIADCQQSNPQIDGDVRRQQRSAVHWRCASNNHYSYKCRSFRQSSQWLWLWLWPGIISFPWRRKMSKSQNTTESCLTPLFPLKEVKWSQDFFIICLNCDRERILFSSTFIRNQQSRPRRWWPCGSRGTGVPCMWPRSTTSQEQSFPRRRTLRAFQSWFRGARHGRA